MKAWKTAAFTMKCGYDRGHLIDVGDAYLEIENEAGIRRVRCAKCAGRHETHGAEEPVTETSAEGPANNTGTEPKLESAECEGEPW